jgi:ectoine hydroxylase-related dioxygenase (phytanoyl-CoA dioxygenase family)
MPELAVDTPLEGSDYQVIHRDAPLRSPDLPDLDPREPFQFAVNFPLIDVALDNGPVEMARGTHLLTDEEARDAVKSGAAARVLEPLLMKVGDLMIRDVRTLHRGTPNFTNHPRPMVVVGYNRRLHRRPQLRIFIPRQTYDTLSERARRMLDLNPIVETIEEAKRSESYSNLDFLDAY